MKTPDKSTRRVEAAEETRRRIVEATFALHAEQGIAATSMKQIAARAGVSVGSVYHHFPTYGDAVGACGAYALATYPAPGRDSFAHLEGRERRVAALVAALFDHFARFQVLERVRCDQHLVPDLAPFVEGELSGRRALLAEAAGGTLSPRQLDLAAALTDPAVLWSLTRAGWSPAAAAAAVTGPLLAGLAPAAD